MSTTASPARLTADSAAATNDRSRGCSRSSDVWLRKIRRGRTGMPSSVATATAARPVFGRTGARAPAQATCECYWAVASWVTGGGAPPATTSEAHRHGPLPIQRPRPGVPAVRGARPPAGAGERPVRGGRRRHGARDAARGGAARRAPAGRQPAGVGPDATGVRPGDAHGPAPGGLQTVLP